jgi:hypothetical protein
MDAHFPYIPLANSLPARGNCHVAKIMVLWDLLDFVNIQNEKRDIGSMITLTGSVALAQATSCSAYLKQNWPSTGSMVLETLQASLDDEKLEASSEFKFQFLKSKIVREIFRVLCCCVWTEENKLLISWLLFL